MKSIYVNCKTSDEAFNLIRLTGSNPAYNTIWAQYRENTVFRLGRDVIEGFDSIKQYRNSNPGIKIISYREFARTYNSNYAKGILDELSSAEKKSLLRHLVAATEIWIESESELGIRCENHNDLVRRIASALDISENEYINLLKAEIKEETIEPER